MLTAGFFAESFWFGESSVRRGVGVTRSSHDLLSALGQKPVTKGRGNDQVAGFLVFGRWIRVTCQVHPVLGGILEIMETVSGRLYLVATPIGNLGDFSPRAREVLGSVDKILAEDTRHTGRLLAKFQIDKPMISLHEHNENARLAPVLADLCGGARYALVTDAGTPAISDPGEYLVREARRAGIAIESVAGPSALAAALAASGFSSTPVLFLGFPPSRGGERKRFFENWKPSPATIVLYEAPHRIEAALDDLAEVFGADRPAILLRELTKVHEEGIDGTLGSIREEIGRRGGVRGEIVIVLAPPRVLAGIAGMDRCRIPEMMTPAHLRARIAVLTGEGLDRADALKQAAREAGLTRSEAYRRLFEDSGENEESGGEPF